MSKLRTEAAWFDAALHEIGDAQPLLEAVEEDLRTAESTETLADLRSNLENAIAGVDALRIQLKAALAASRGREP